MQTSLQLKGDLFILVFEQKRIFCSSKYWQIAGNLAKVRPMLQLLACQQKKQIESASKSQRCCSGTTTLGATMEKWLLGRWEVFSPSFQLISRTEQNILLSRILKTLKFRCSTVYPFTEQALCSSAIVPSKLEQKIEINFVANHNLL